MKTIMENKFSFTVPVEMNMYYCGERTETLNHTYGPEIRQHYLLMYCVDGSATFYGSKGNIRFGTHDLLIMFPNERIFYKVDEGTKWTSWWVGVYGTMVDKFIGFTNIKPDYPFIHINDSYNMEMIMKNLFDNSKENILSCKMKCISLIYELFSFLYNNSDTVESDYDIVRNVINIIHHNDNIYLSVKSIAEKLHVNPCYLSRIFRQKIGMSPKNYIYEYKISHAQELLIQTRTSIAEISLSVGINDSMYFSRIFKKKTGLTPGEYRKNHYKDR